MVATQVQRRTAEPPVPQIMDGDELSALTMADGAILGVGPAGAFADEPDIESPEAGPGEVLFRQRLRTGEVGIEAINTSQSRVRYKGKTISPFVRVWRTGAGAGEPAQVRGTEAVISRVALVHALSKEVGGQPVFSLKRLPRAPTTFPCPIAEGVGCKKLFANEIQAQMHYQKKHRSMWEAQSRTSEHGQIAAVRAVAEASQAQAAQMALLVDQQTRMLTALMDRYDVTPQVAAEVAQASTDAAGAPTAEAAALPIRRGRPPRTALDLMPRDAAEAP